MIRTALLSFWHVHARGYAEQARNIPDIDLIAAWDYDIERGKAGAKELGLEFVDDLDLILARTDIDAVIVQTATSMHLDIITRAARAGKHVITDKVLATTVKEANEIVRAADEAGVVLVTGMPHLHHDYTRRIRQLIDSQQLGDIVNVRMMNCHGQALDGSLPAWFFNAEEAQGGALVDMCHIVYLTPHFFGNLPKSVFAVFGSFANLQVEDSAIAVAEFDDGSHATLEASFVTKGAPRFEIEINGTEGSVLFVSDSHPNQTGAPGDHTLVARLRGEDKFSPVQLAEPGPSPMMQWSAHILNGSLRHTENIERALDLSRINEAAYRSAYSGVPVTLDSLDE